jgi:hypothetical protein
MTGQPQAPRVFIRDVKQDRKKACPKCGHLNTIPLARPSYGSEAQIPCAKCREPIRWYWMSAAEREQEFIAFTIHVGEAAEMAGGLLPPKHSDKPPTVEDVVKWMEESLREMHAVFSVQSIPLLRRLIVRLVYLVAELSREVVQARRVAAEKCAGGTPAP